MPFDKVTGRVRRAARRERALRVLLVPAHRQLQHQAQQPQRGPGAARAGSGQRLDRGRAALQRRLPGGQFGRPRGTRDHPGDRARSPAAPCPPGPTPTSRTRSSPRRAGCGSWRWSTRSRARPLVAALRELKAMVDRSPLRVSFPVEVRTAPADDITLSTASGRDSAYIAVHMYQGTPVPGVLHRGRADHDRARRAAALGQGPHPGRRVPRRGLPAVRRVHGAARPAGPGAAVPERLSAAGVWAT